MGRYQIIKGLWTPFSHNHLSAYGAAAAFYLLVSLLPASMLFLSLLPYLPQGVISDSLLQAIIPKALLPILYDLWISLYEMRSFTLVSISAITTLWSASKGILAITDGLNTAFDVPKQGNFIKRSLISMLYFLLLTASITMTLLISVLGDQLYFAVIAIFIDHSHILSVLLKLRWMVIFPCLGLLFFLLYRLLPSKGLPVRYCIAVSALASLGWLALSFFFSIYVNHFSNLQHLYGSIGLLLLAAIWLRICMALVLYGGLLIKLLANNSYHPWEIIKSALAKQRH